MADNSRRGLNYLYYKYIEKIKISEIGANPAKYLKRDGYHLNNEAGTYISSEIKKHFYGQSRTTIRTPTCIRTVIQKAQHTTTTSFISQKSDYKHITGTERDNIKKINETNSTTTTRSKEAEPEHATIEITGTNEAICVAAWQKGP